MTSPLYTLITSRIVAVKRRQNTADGNPRWTIQTEAGTWNTDDDSQAGFGPNESHVGRQVTLNLSSEGRVIRYVTTDVDTAETEENTVNSFTGPTTENRYALTAWTLTAGEIEDVAGRRLTDDELADVAEAIQQSSIRELIGQVLDGLGIADDDENAG